ncbi:M16 family metallopeptidase [Kitasatospora saccharophila]|uniref:M16 family metallopeptidase n=1 Tax=Kitasatospora saccharophila TaxID=407973 RepID=UPI0036346D19
MAAPVAVHRSRPGPARSACAMLLLSSGSWADPVGKSGLAHLYEHGFFAGAGPYPTAQSVAAAASALGHDFNAHTAAEYSAFQLNGPDETLPRALDLLLTCYTAPRWDPAELAAQSTAIGNELRMFADDRQRRLRHLVTAALHGPGPFARPPLGAADEIARLTTADVAAFARDRAGADRLTLLIDAPGHHPGLDEVIARHLGDAAGAGRPVPGTAPDGYGPLVHTALELPGRTALVALAVPGVSYLLSTREMYAVRLFHAALGAMPGNRISTRLRGELGLAYQARTVLEPHASTGALIAVLGCAPERVTEAVDALHALLEEALAKPMTDGELERAAAMNRGVHVRDRETAHGRCAVIGQEVLRRGAAQEEGELFALWGDIGPEEVLRTVRRTLMPEAARCVVVGPVGCADGLHGSAALPGSWRTAG